MITRTVLIVDDDVDIQESLRDALTDEGYDVFVAANGREALAKLPSLRRPCAIILDSVMPIMNGTEFYQSMKAMPAFTDIPVLISCSDPSNTPPGVPVMKKPVNLDRLLVALAALF